MMPFSGETPMFNEYESYDALGLAELVRSKQTTAAELVEAALYRMDILNSQLNAVVYRMDERARDRARQPLPDGPFAGVPFLLKDLITSMADTPLTSGCRALRAHAPDHDHDMVVRYRRAGLIILGRTNTPELGLSPVTEPAAWGPTHNPWDLSRTPSGSSGGSAAAVAARIVPMADGSDGGGSLRTPASACGVFGLKPSRGRNPCGPDHAELWQGLATGHALTRSVRDSAAMLDAVSGPALGSPYVAPPPQRPFLDEVGAAPGALRIAVATTGFLSNHVDRDCIAAVEETRAVLEELGHTVVDAQPAMDRKPFIRAFLTVIAGEVATDLGEMRAPLGRAIGSGDVEPSTRMMAAIGRSLRGDELNLARRYLYRASRQIAAFFQDHDLLVTPTLARPPVRTGALTKSRIESVMLEGLCHLRACRPVRDHGQYELMAQPLIDYSGFTNPFNVTGQPAASLPLYWNAQQLPIGVQVAARYGDEATLLRVCAQLEQALPWADRKPPVCVG
jgi:amidase